MKKHLLIVAILSIIPSVAFASWWNPLTWNIFSPHQPSPQVQIISTTTPLDQVLTNNSTTTATTTISIATTTEATVATTSTPKINISIKKVTPPIKTPTPPVQVQTPVVSNSSAGGSAVCPDGFTCTTTGQSAITDQQMCANSYGQNSVYTGNRNSNGGPVCGCPTGYAWNSNNTSCVTPTEACSEVNASWDGKIANSQADCHCNPGYVSDSTGTTCQIPNTPDSSQTATSPLDCYVTGMTDGYKILNDAQTVIQSTLAVGEEQAQASERNSASLNSYLKALATICNTSLSTDQINSKLSQIQNQLKQVVSTSQQQQQQIQGLQKAQAALATPGANNPLNFLLQGAGYNAPAIENTISHIYQPAISAIQSQQQPTTVQSKTDMYGAVFAALDGMTIYVNNGGTYTRSGNNIYGPNGASYVISGSTIYGPGGTSYVLDGATLYGPNGTTYTQSGNTISGSDGSSATAVGNTIYVKSSN